MWRFLSDPARCRHRAAALAALVAAATIVSASAQPPGDHPPPPGHGGGMMGFDRPPGFSGRHVDRMLDGLGATPAQRDRIHQIVAAAGADLDAQRLAGRGLHQRGLQIFTAPTVDPAAAESLRQELQTQHDHASRRVLDAMLEIANVLTPDQRAKIGARLQERQAIMAERRQRMSREHPPAPTTQRP